MAVDVNKYKETKVCQCIACGKDVTVTKFASASKVMCNECKASGAEANPEIIKSATKKVEPRAQHEGNTKICQCIQCGVDVEVTKFASASKVLCPSCKGDGGDTSFNGEINRRPKIDLSKVDRNVIPPLEEFIAQPTLFANKNLRDVTCPACGEPHMRILKVMDWSVFGLIIHYQCTKCLALVSVSEQTKVPIKIYEPGSLYDYCGQKLSAGDSSVEQSRMTGLARRLYNLCVNNNIDTGGIELPPYIWENERPVPVGFVIPRGDRDIKTVENAIKLLEQARGLPLDVEDTNAVIDGLKKLFTVEGNGDDV